MSFPVCKGHADRVEFIWGDPADEGKPGRTVRSITEVEVGGPNTNLADKQRIALDMTQLAQLEHDITWKVRDVEDENNALEEADSTESVIITGKGGNKSITHRSLVFSVAWDGTKGTYLQSVRKTRR